MPFGVVSGVGLGMGVLDFGGDCARGRGSLEGMNLPRPIITNGEFLACIVAKRLIGSGCIVLQSRDIDARWLHDIKSTAFECLRQTDNRV